MPLDYWLAAVVIAGLLIYLIYALLRKNSRGLT